jgi:hypothetical protein
MTILCSRLTILVASCMAMTITPTLTSACDVHATGHAVPKLLDKSLIPANAFRYVNKPTATDTTTAVVPSPSAVAPPTLPVGPPR